MFSDVYRFPVVLRNGSTLGNSDAAGWTVFVLQQHATFGSSFRSSVSCFSISWLCFCVSFDIMARMSVGALEVQRASLYASRRFWFSKLYIAATVSYNYDMK